MWRVSNQVERNRHRLGLGDWIVIIKTLLGPDLEVRRVWRCFPNFPIIQTKGTSDRETTKQNQYRRAGNEVLCLTTQEIIKIRRPEDFLVITPLFPKRCKNCTLIVGRRGSTSPLKYRPYIHDFSPHIGDTTFVWRSPRATKR